jgi:hypothetical protein
MKIYTKNSTIFICAIGLLSSLFSSCTKTPVNYTIAPPIAGLSFIQASPDQPPMDLFIGGGKINLNPVSYGQSIGYLNIYAGNDSVTFNNDATTKTILSTNITFNQNTIYSMFLANTTSNPEVVVLKDTLNKPSAGNAGIRFVDLSPDAPAVDLVIKGGAVIVANKLYKGYSSFVPVPGNIFYTIEVHQAGTATVLATLTNVKIDSGYLYTMWFHGLAAGTTATDKLSLDMLNNAYFL